MSYEKWCKHYTGIYSETCEAGISYKDVKGDKKIPLNYPCFKDSGCTVVCPKAEFRTSEEVAEKEREMDEILQKFLDNLKNDICPHCGTPIKEKKQVGRCVYSVTCGCRLYQGHLKKEETHDA